MVVLATYVMGVKVISMSTHNMLEVLWTNRPSFLSMIPKLGLPRSQTPLYCYIYLNQTNEYVRLLTCVQQH